MDNINLSKINKNDHFIRNKKKYIKLSIVSGILLVVFLSLTVVFWFKVNATRTHYQKVTVNVESVYDAEIGNDVTVTYENKSYEFINVTDSEFYIYETSEKLGRSVEVLLGDDGKMYSNTDGIKTHTITGKIYFAFLACTFILVFATPTLIGCVVEAKKREKGIYPNVI